MTKGPFVFFYGGILSQWYPCTFQIDGVKYNCAEQYMMAEKARLFGDQEILEKIMSSKNPREQKKYGRKVKNFDEKKWNSVAKDIVYKGNYAKFSQNIDSGDIGYIFFNTPGTFVEASPYDTIWGIGIGMDDPRINDPSQWRGTNWLGEVLTKVRDDWYKKAKIRSEEILIDLSDDD